MHQDNRIRNPHLNTKYITNWETWKEICMEWKVDPYEYRDLSIGIGGGNSIDYEYIGDTPKKEE